MGVMSSKIWLVILLLVGCLSNPAMAQNLYDEIMVAQGIRELQQENYDEALSLLKTAWDKGSKTPEKAYYLGVANFRLGAYGDSLFFLEKAVQLEPKFHEARLQLAAVYLALDQPSLALPHLEQLQAAGYKPAQTAMFLGQAAMKQKRYAEAVAYFRQAEEDPQLAQEAKLQASQALAAQNRYREAKMALSEAIALAPETREADFARRYLGAVERRLEETKPFRFHLGASFDYDSNVSLEPGNAAAAGIAPLGRGDVVFTQVADLEYELFPTGSFGLLAGYNLFQTWHRRLTLYDVMSHTFGLTPAWRGETTTFWLPFRFNYIDLSSDRYWTAYTLTPTVVQMLKPNLALELSFKWARNYYWWFQPVPQEDRSSKNYGGGLGLYYFFKQGKGYLQGRFNYEYQDAAGSNWSNSSYRVLLAALYPLTDRLRLNPALELVYQPYDHQWFDGLNYNGKRRDKMLILGLQAMYKLVKGLDFNVHYYFIRDNSNIALYDYDRHIIGAMLDYRY